MNHAVAIPTRAYFPVVPLWPHVRNTVYVVNMLVLSIHIHVVIHNKATVHILHTYLSGSGKSLVNLV